MIRSKRSAVHTAGLLACVSSIVWALSTAKPAPAPAVPVSSALPGGYAGSASCSAGACHGRNSPVDDKNAIALQNEYTHSVMYDKHTQAYDVLLKHRAMKIAENLAPTNKDGKKIDADKDPRCLACHATPESAWDLKSGSISIEVQNWHKGGVSCEACHGPALKPDRSWLGVHTSRSQWRDAKKASEKEPYGFVDLSNLATLTQVCAGCHVGAPRNDSKKLPARDCNHDIMAAGHPRLNFELSTFIANMPPHWNTRLKLDAAKKQGGVESFHAKVWAVGRVGSAKASLDLLAARTAEQTRWPEFAEYRCYTCHTDLNNHWKQATPDTLRPKGSLPYDTWYNSLLPEWNPEVKSGYDALRTEMARAAPVAGKVSDEATKLSATLKTWVDRLNEQKVFNPEDMLSTLIKEAKETQKLPRAWEDATQLVLAIALLSKDADRKDLQTVLDALMFPRDGEGPKGLDGPAADQEKVQEAFKRLLSGLK